MVLNYWRFYSNYNNLYISIRWNECKCWCCSIGTWPGQTLLFGYLLQKNAQKIMVHIKRAMVEVCQPVKIAQSCPPTEGARSCDNATCGNPPLNQSVVGTTNKEESDKTKPNGAVKLWIYGRRPLLLQSNGLMWDLGAEGDVCIGNEIKRGKVDIVYGHFLTFLN